jgi:hypothetical protein
MRNSAIAVTFILATVAVAQARGDRSTNNAETSQKASTGAATNIPDFNYEPGCRIDLQAGASTQGRSEYACIREEKIAKAKLEKEWSEFGVGQKSLCTKLETTGGNPSYAEFLTCLEMGKAVAELPKDATSITR